MSHHYHLRYAIPREDTRDPVLVYDELSKSRTRLEAHAREMLLRGAEDIEIGTCDSPDCYCEF